MTQIKLLALDLDDSLLDKNCEITQRTIIAIKKAIKKGIHVTIATGRMFRSTLPYARQLEINLPLITYQGALVQTSDSGEIIYSKSVPLDLAKEILLDLRIGGFPANIYLDDVLYVEEDTKDNREYAQMSRVEMHIVGKLDEYLEKRQLGSIKVLGIGEEKKLDDLACVLREKYRDRLYITKSKPYFLEFMHPDATKGKALKAVAEYLKIAPENIAAVGDSFNDLTMFDYAGLAVVMGNAKDLIKEYADIVIAPNYEEGVAQFIEKYILKESEE